MNVKWKRENHYHFLVSSVPLNYIMFKKNNNNNSGSNFESFRINKGPYIVVCAGWEEFDLSFLSDGRIKWSEVSEYWLTGHLQCLFSSSKT